MMSEGWGTNLISLGSLKEEEEAPENSLSLQVYADEKVIRGHSKKVAIGKPGKEVLPETNADNTLILDVLPLEL